MSEPGESCSRGNGAWLSWHWISSEMAYQLHSNNAQGLSFADYFENMHFHGNMSIMWMIKNNTDPCFAGQI